MHKYQNIKYWLDPSSHKQTRTSVWGRIPKHTLSVSSGFSNEIFPHRQCSTQPTDSLSATEVFQLREDVFPVASPIIAIFRTANLKCLQCSRMIDRSRWGTIECRLRFVVATCYDHQDLGKKCQQISCISWVLTCFHMFSSSRFPGISECV